MQDSGKGKTFKDIHDSLIEVFSGRKLEDIGYATYRSNLKFHKPMKNEREIDLHAFGRAIVGFHGLCMLDQDIQPRDVGVVTTFPTAPDALSFTFGPNPTGEFGDSYCYAFSSNHFIMELPDLYNSFDVEYIQRQISETFEALNQYVVEQEAVKIYGNLTSKLSGQSLQKVGENRFQNVERGGNDTFCCCKKINLGSLEGRIYFRKISSPTQILTKNNFAGLSIRLNNGDCLSINNHSALYEELGSGFKTIGEVTSARPEVEQDIRAASASIKSALDKITTQRREPLRTK